MKLHGVCPEKWNKSEGEEKLPDSATNICYVETETNGDNSLTFDFKTE